MIGGISKNLWLAALNSMLWRLANGLGKTFKTHIAEAFEHLDRSMGIFSLGFGWAGDIYLGASILQKPLA